MLPLACRTISGATGTTGDRNMRRVNFSEEQSGVIAEAATTVHAIGYRRRGAGGG